MNLSEVERARLLELAVDRAVLGLSVEEELELERMLGSHGIRVDDSFERAAAAIDLSRPRLDEPLPRLQAERAAQAAERYFAPLRHPSTLTVRRARDRPAASVAVAAPGRPAWQGFFAGALAAAVAALLLWPAPTDSVESMGSAQESASLAAQNAPPGADPAVDSARRTEALEREPRSAVEDSTPTPAELRNRLLASQRFLLRRNWSSGGDSAGSQVRGDVVWDANRQEGYLRFTGLRRNDPALEQYQLWIFDGRRDARYPIDGGVFDSGNQEQEVVIPIRAALPVGSPQLFAVTLEKPGGVVVSDRRRVVVVARIT